MHIYKHIHAHTQMIYFDISLRMSICVYLTRCSSHAETAGMSGAMAANSHESFGGNIGFFCGDKALLRKCRVPL